jgi:putative ABC transport system permease protein
MTAFPLRLLERWLSSDVSAYVVGDLVERGVGGAQLWIEAVSALWTLKHSPRSGDPFMTSFFGDLRLAARLLRRSPAFTIVSVMTLALGIGATTAIFSVVRPVLLEPLPYPNPERVVMVWERNRDGSHDNIGFLTFHDMVAQSKTIQTAAAVGSWQPIIGAATGPERVIGDRVSWTYFRTLGVHPMLGRDFAVDEDQPGRNTVVVLSHGLWAKSFGSDSGLVGKTILINGTPMTVIGVMDQSFQNVMSPNAQIWRVLGYAETQPWACRTCHHLRMVARLRPGIDRAAAIAELDAIHHRLEAAYPKEYGSVGAAIVSVKDEATREYRPAILALAGAVLVMLLIAIANVVSMQLARAVRRDEEFAIRTALGAGERRLMRQLVTEGLLLAVLGGIGGVIVAIVAVPVLVSRLPEQLPRLGEIHVDMTALLVVGAIVLALSLIVGLAPARSRRVGEAGDLAATLRSGRRLASGGNHAMRSGLVVGEVALALMLLVGCGLLARSMVGLLAVNTGFDPSHLLTLEVNSVGPRYPDDASVFQYHDRVRDAVRAMPGVVSVAVANQLPLGGNMDMYGVQTVDRPLDNPELAPSGDRYVVSAEFWRTMRIPIVAGRGFDAHDERDSTGRVTMLSAALAAELWPGENPIGKQVRYGGETRPIRTVVGVVGNIRHSGLDESVTRQFYVPERQWFFSDNEEVLVIRTEGDPSSVVSSVRRMIAQIDPTQPIVKVATMQSVIAASTAQRRLALVLFVAFGATSLLLAIAGIYGVLAGRVAERTREIGVRGALGAGPRDILVLVMSQGVRLAIIGLGLGLAGALGLTRFLATMLFGVAATDPTTIGGVIVVLFVVILVACLVPALRAVRIDPSLAMRVE